MLKKSEILFMFVWTYHSPPKCISKTFEMFICLLFYQVYDKWWENESKKANVYCSDELLKFPWEYWKGKEKYDECRSSSKPNFYLICNLINSRCFYYQLFNCGCVSNKKFYLSVSINDRTQELPSTTSPVHSNHT